MRTVNGVKFTNNGHSSRERLHLDVDGQLPITKQAAKMWLEQSIKESKNEQ